MNNERTMTKVEASIIGHMLSETFNGADVLQQQLIGCKVRDTEDSDGYGSIYLVPISPVKASVNSRVPVEAHYADRDGGDVTILLHVIDGRLNELEIFKSDGTTLLQAPTNMTNIVSSVTESSR